MLRGFYPLSGGSTISPSTIGCSVTGFAAHPPACLPAAWLKGGRRCPLCGQTLIEKVRDERISGYRGKHPLCGAAGGGIARKGKQTFARRGLRIFPVAPAKKHR